MICLGCGKKGHRVANCPNPQAANLAENETASFICFSEHLEEKPGLQEAPIGIDFQEDVMENQVTPQETNSMETEIAAFLQDDDHEAVDGEAYATGITTHQAVQQGKAVLDCGATRSIGSVKALEQLMAVNMATYMGTHGSSKWISRTAPCSASATRPWTSAPRQ